MTRLAKATILPIVPTVALLLILLLTLGATTHAESFESWSAKADKALKTKQDAIALEDYSKALALWHEEDGKAAKAKALAARAELYEKEGQPDVAKADLTQAIVLSPKRAAYFARRGHAELDLGELDGAITDLYRATSLDLSLREAYLDRGLAYARQGDLKFAREDYQTACKLGLKAGCARAAALKTRLAGKGKPARAPSEDFEAMKPKRNGPVEIRRQPARTPRKLDLTACRSSLDACVDSGLSFGECVSQSRKCPRACVTAFDRLASARSEAAAFREVFEGENCSGSPVKSEVSEP